jgi:2,4-dienoyl-CoA reductase (NADPH2)
MAVNSKFLKLLEPGQIGNVKTKNRIVKPTSSLGYQYDEDDGHITERFLHFCEAFARGGAGLMVIEGGTIDYTLSAHDYWHFRIDKDVYIPGWKKITDIVHKYDMPIFAQMVHSGPWHRKEMDGKDPIASSPDIMVEEGGRPSRTRAASVEEIKTAVGKFVDAADRYSKAGFDGVEINASGNHLLNSFLSLGFNTRHDEYGIDTLENRCRIVVEIIQGVKERVGKDFVVGLIFNAMEYGVKNGLTIEETQQFAKIYEKNGIDYLQVRVDGIGKYLSSHYPELIHYPEPPKPLGRMLDGSRHGAGGYVPLAAAIKSAVPKVPVIAVGRIDPEMGEQILQDGKADFIAMNKRQLADPELANKVKEGRMDDIAPCTACETCISYRVHRLPVQCRINAALGSEEDYVIKSAKIKKNVVVIGGGPAGLEAARVAAIRGHQVTLLEKSHRLGGSVLMAGILKGYDGEDLISFVRYFKIQLKKLGVDIRLHTEFKPSMLNELKPDVVILAVGGKMKVPEIPGINSRIVLTAPVLHSRLKGLMRFFTPQFLQKITQYWVPIGKKAVIIGGEIQGAELAEFLVKRGRKVVILSLNEKPVGYGLPKRKQQLLVEWLHDKGVSIYNEIVCEKITDKGVHIITKEGKKLFIEADTIIPALPFEPNNDIFEILKAKVKDIYHIGDGSNPNLIVDAIAQGWKVANTI